MTTHPAPAEPDERPYGERFLDAWRRYTGGVATFNYATIRRLKGADREEFIRALRENNSMMPYAVIQLLRDCGPEEAARHLYLGHQQAMMAMIIAII